MNIKILYWATYIGLTLFGIFSGYFFFYLEQIGMTIDFLSSLVVIVFAVEILIAFKLVRLQYSLYRKA